MLNSVYYIPLMRLALFLAKKAYAIHEVPIGAVVYSPIKGVVGMGYNQTITQNNPTAHAENIAIQDACIALGNYRIPECYLITTIEPCLLCLGTSIHARIRGIIYGATEPKTGAITHSIIPKHLTTHLAYIQGGILAEECKNLMQCFFTERRKRK